MKKFLIKLLIFFLLSVAICSFSLYLYGSKTFLKQEASLNLLEEATNDSTITFFAVGDIMLDRGVESMIKKEGTGDFRFPFLKIADYLKKADILFGNLESQISDKIGPKAKKTGSVRVHFKANPKAIEGLVYADFDIVSVANNHALDYGREVFKDGLKRLEKAGIEYIGGGFNEEEVFSVKIQEIKGTKIGFLAYTYPKFDKCYVPWKPTENKPGVAVIEKTEIKKIQRDITGAKKKVDILIISLHWGKEYSLEPTPFKVSLAKSFVEAGADLVIGHHPHVVQPLEKYKDGWIVYSLGNFVFDQTSKETKIGGLLEVIIRNKKIQKIKLNKTQNSDFFQPSLVID